MNGLLAAILAGAGHGLGAAGQQHQVRADRAAATKKHAEILAQHSSEAALDRALRTRQLDFQEREAAGVDISGLNADATQSGLPQKLNRALLPFLVQERAQKAQLGFLTQQDKLQRERETAKSDLDERRHFDASRALGASVRGLGQTRPTFADPTDEELGAEEPGLYRPTQTGTGPASTPADVVEAASSPYLKNVNLEALTKLIPQLGAQAKPEVEVSAPYAGSDAQGPGMFVAVTDKRAQTTVTRRVGGMKPGAPISHTPTNALLSPDDPTKVLVPAVPEAPKPISHTPTNALLSGADPTTVLVPPQPKPPEMKVDFKQGPGGEWYAITTNEQGVVGKPQRTLGAPPSAPHAPTQGAEYVKAVDAHLASKYGAAVSPQRLAERVDLLKPLIVPGGGVGTGPTGTVQNPGPPLAPPAAMGEKIISVDAEMQGLQDLLRMAQSPNVQSVLGGMLANPVGRGRRALSEILPTLDNEQRLFFAALAEKMEPLKSRLIGASRTSKELEGLVPLIPAPGDYYGIPAKITALIQGLQTHRGAYENYLNQTRAQVPARPGAQAPTAAPARPAAPQGSESPDARALKKFGG